MLFLKKYWPGILLTIISIVIGLATYQQIGMGMDEYDQRNMGLAYYSYVFENDTNFHHYIERDHGAGFELPLVMLEKKLDLTDTHDIYTMRHIVTHLFFIVCALFGYVLAYRLFGNNQLLACLTYLVLVYHPRLYGQSFVNTKDIPAMSSLLVCMATIRWATEKQKPWPWILCGFACGYSASIRLMNVIILVPLFVFFLADAIQAYKDGRLQSVVRNGVALLLAFCISIYICWPTLWLHPIDSFIYVYKSLAKFRWQGNVLFCGQVINAKELPWQYIITWFGITTPFVWLAGGAIGIILLLVTFIKKPMEYIADASKRMLLLFLFCFIVPMLIVVMLHAVMYDDWRHLYFTYPSFVMLLIYAVYRISNNRLRIVALMLCFIELAGAIGFIYRYHPYELVYFNRLISYQKDAAQKKFELDYWGTATIAGMRWVLAHDSSDTIFINHTNTLRFSMMLLKPDERKRFVLTDEDDKQQYYLESFRTAPFIYPESKSSYDIIVRNNTIFRVVKLK